MDVVIMQIAIAEMLTFPNIPVSVTINEYVELAKLYSTHRSGGYINGMLDTIARGLITHGLMMKAMPEPRPKKQPDNGRNSEEKKHSQQPEQQVNDSEKEHLGQENVATDNVANDA